MAGFTGTLRARYPSDATGTGIVRAKTGTLTGVNTLAGTVVDADGRLLAFAFLATETDSQHEPAEGAADATSALRRRLPRLGGSRAQPASGARGPRTEPAADQARRHLHRSRPQRHAHVRLTHDEHRWCRDGRLESRGGDRDPARAAGPRGEPRRGPGRRRRAAPARQGVGGTRPGLHPDDARRHEPDDTPVLVVDRAGWVRANVAGFRELLKPLLDKMQERRASTPGGAVLGAVGGKVTGVELGMLLSFLSSRVLGQYETFAPATRELPGGGERRRPAAPRRAEHRARGARTRRRPPRLPALGLSARGDAPHAVHRPCPGCGTTWRARSSRSWARPRSTP